MARTSFSPSSALVFLLAGLALPGAGPPEVRRVRAPAAKITGWFPNDADLVGMAREEFDDLVRRAEEGARRDRERRSPRLLRVRHSARWDSGVLSGRSELLIEGVADRATRLELAPWTPAIDPASPSATLLRVGPDGRTAAAVGPSGVTGLTLDWELRARPGSEGRGFNLGLPRVDAAELILELPEGWVPEGPRGLRQGPGLASMPGLGRWRFLGPGGPIDLHLLSGSAAEGPRPSAWVEGPTRVEIAEGGASWRADWRVDPGREGVRRLAADLDPGLELIDVAGPGVASFRAEPGGGGTRVTIRLAADVAGPTPLAIRARAPVPDEGPWPVPAARPVDAIWTGGRTIVRVGPSRVVESCRERAGRRVEPGLDELEIVPLAGTPLVFEALAPASVAELTLRKPTPDASAEVRGWLSVGRDVARWEAQVAWKVRRGSLSELAVDLPPGWSLDRVAVPGGGEPAPWQVEPRPGGGSRLHVLLPPSLEGAQAPTLDLAAVADDRARSGPLDLPRARPVGVRVADETWLAMVQPGWSVRPIAARGLAWLDPAALGEGPTPAPGLRPTLAWRWTEETAEGRIDRVKSAAETIGSTQVLATIGPGRLRSDWIVEVNRADGDDQALAVFASEPISEPPLWRLVGDESATPLPARPIGADRRSALGFSMIGSAWEIELPRPARGRRLLHARVESAWSGRGTIPLIALPARYQARGTVLVAVDRSMLSRARATGQRTLDPAFAWAQAQPVPPSPGESPASAAAGPRRAHAFGSDGPHPGRLEVETESLGPVPAEGVITEAALATVAEGSAPRSQRLTLAVVSTGARDLAVTLPAGATLQAARLDGEAITPSRRGKALSVPLPAPDPSRPSSTITLEYTEAGAKSEGTIRPDRPRFSMPVLAFTWSLSVPETLRPESWGPSLVPADPRPDRPWSSRLLGDWPAPSIRRSGPRIDPEQARDLGDHLRATRPEEIALGDLFARWDAGRWPLVIDRPALSSAGWGPGTRIVPRRPDPRLADPAADLLAPIGLAAVPTPEALLITTAEAAGAQGRETETARDRQVARAAVEGADGADRYQSVAHWRGEPTPDRPAGDGRPVASDRTFHFAAEGWPESGGAAALSDAGSQSAGRWAISAAFVALGIACRRLPAPRRAAVAGLTLALALPVAAWAPPRLANGAAGAACGAVGVLAYWLGRALRPSPSPGGRSGRSWQPGRAWPSGSGAAVPLLLAMLSASLTARLVAEETATDRPILALFPFDDVAELSGPGERVVLLESDRERLRALAEAGADRPEPSRVAASASEHRIHRDGQAAFVESRYDLWLDRDEPASWPLPIGPARELSAELDGRTAPVRIPPGEKSAGVLIGGAGRHRLIFRRVLDLDRGEALALPITAVTSARVDVAAVPGRVIEVGGARGRIVPRGGGVSGGLGPVDRLDIRWVSGERTDLSAPRGSVAGLVLWDALPAGDRVRARFTYRDIERTARVRLALEPGWVVRSAEAPGVIDATIQGTAERPEWVAFIDPPLGDGESITLDLWRSAGDPVGGGGGRRAPRVEPLDVDRQSTAMGLRRPADWSGRLRPGSGAEPLADQEFVRLLGPLPMSPLRFAGAVRSPRPTGPLVRLQPSAGRLSARSAVQIGLVPGRIEVRSETRITDDSGRGHEAEVRVPKALQIVEAEAEGLTDWSRPSADRLRLRFDGPGAKERSIRLEGWMPVAADPIGPAAARQAFAIPWPTWIDANEEPGTLTVAAPPGASFNLDAGPGVEPVATTEPAAAPGPRRSYRVERREGLGEVRWTPAPPRLSVAIRSLLTLHPGSAEWVASARYQVAGGPSDTIELSMPRAWAESARLDLAGAGHRLATRAEGDEVVWTVRLDVPIWGTRPVLIRAERPFGPGRALYYPRLVPLGFGSVDTFVAWADASGSGVRAEVSSGLQSVDPKRLPPDELPGPPGPGRHVEHVLREDWTLRLRSSGDDAHPDAGGGLARVELADMECVLSPDETGRGLARYECGPGAFLSLALPDGLEPLAAAVDGRPVRPLRRAKGPLFIPMPDGGRGRVDLVWRAGPADGRAIDLPAPTSQVGPTLVTIYAPDSLAIGPAEGLSAGDAGAVAAERAAWQGRRVLDLIARSDLASAQDRAEILAACVAFEHREKAAERAGRITALRAEVDEALRSAGLEAIGRSARARAGDGDDPSPSIPTTPERSSPLRLRRLGTAHYFVGDSTRSGRPIQFRWSLLADATWRRESPWAVGILALLAALVPLWVASRGLRPGRLGLLGLAAWVVAAIAGVAPSALAAGLAMVGLGRFSAD